ncbi:esterase-like activity of phytase family protein [Rhodobacterales bacterium HKCCE2091]|nr:esterase-like activity of phytase family protein [Rhodobacterales bacterium HKCCE2091]
MRRDPVRRRRRKLIASAILCLAALSGPVRAEDAEVIGHFTWRSWRMALGGLSGLEVAPDGGALTAVTDRGHMVRADIERDAEGRITGMTGVSITRLLTATAEWPFRTYLRDAEGLAAMPDGTFAVSFEGFHHIDRYGPDAAYIDSFPMPVEATALQSNLGLEALAADAEGGLYAIPELWSWSAPSFPILHWDGRLWREVAGLPPGAYISPVGLDIDEEGRLVILERAFNERGGFFSRVRRVTIGPDRTLAEDEVLWTSSWGDYSNLEGISLWRDAGGATIATLVSDDNFNPLLPTELVELRLPD